MYPVKPVYSPPPTDSDGIQPQGEPCRLWSLWDIMQRFKAMQVAFTLRDFTALRIGCRASQSGGGGGDPLSDERVAEVETLFADVEALLKDSEFNAAHATAIFARGHYQVPEIQPDTSTLAADLRHFENDLLNDISKQAFLRVSKERRKYLENKAPFGEQVSEAFPSARFDLTEAGNCLAADCNTAAVFHLMRAVEWGLRALAVDLGVKRLRTKNPKTGKRRYYPLAWGDWEQILNTLRSKVEKRIATLTKGRKKQLYAEFYLPALQDIQAFKEAWRNHVMHTRSEYGASDADAILVHVKSLMVKLATRVSEV